jgi:phage minor structural protein
MIPILFSKNETSFTSNGLGRFSEAISCKVTEERNGQYELEMVYPIDGKLYPMIETEMIIGAIPSVDASLQAFDIYRITKPINGKVTIFAQHISYRLLRIVTTGANIPASNDACQAALNSLKTNAILATGQTCPFTFWTDKRTAAGFSMSTPTSIRTRLGGSEGSILDQFGGEYEWDNFTVKLHADRGSDTNVTLMYGKNLTELTHEENVSGAVTGVIGFWQHEDEVVTGSVQLASNHASYARERIIAVDFSSTIGTEKTPPVSVINNLAQIYANQHNLPNISMKISFVDLSQTEEYKLYAPLEKLHLCDYVMINYEKLKVMQKARIIKTVYNVLLDRYNSIEVGDTIGTLAQAVTDTLAQELSSVSWAALNATQWLTRGDGYVVAIKNDDGSWREILFMDTKDISTAHNVLRLNTNGLGFSTTGVNGVYTNAWTIDGHLVADFIDTGTLNAAKATIINLNASNISTGYLSADRIAANSIAVSKLTGKISNNNWEINLDNGTLTIGNISANNINAGTLSADRIAANSIAVSKLTGSIQNGSWKLDLDSGTFTIGTISADNITAGTIDASEITVTNINANNITAGTIDASEITITNLDADNITAGTLSDRYGNTSWNLDTGVLTSENFTLDAGNLYLSSSGLIRSGDDYGRKITLNDGLLIGYYENDERVRLDLSSLNFIIDFKSKFDDTLPSYFGIKYDGSLKFWVEGSETWCTTKMYTQAINANGMVDAQGGFAISGVTGKDYNINLVQ